MSYGAALTEFVTIKRIFSWTIDNFDDIQREHLEKEEESPGSCVYILKSPEMTAIDPYTGVKYKASLKIQFLDDYGVIILDCKPKLEVFHYSVQINDRKHLQKGNCVYWKYNLLTKFWLKITKLTIFIDYVTKKNSAFEVDSFKFPQQSNGIFNRLKEIWENDSSVKVTLKAGNAEIQAIKPFLAAHSPVFKVMFEINMKEKAENCVQIPDYDSNVVQKLVDFCENEASIDFDGCEIEVFKIAHQYQMDDLMGTVLEKMAEQASKNNIKDYLELAKFYDLKEFEKWLMNFACRNNYLIE